MPPLNQKINNNLLHLHLRQLSAKTASGLLSAAALWPIIEAAQKGDLQTVIAFGQVAGELGKNILSEKLMEWQQSVKTEQQAVTTIEADMEADAELRESLDLFLEKLDVITAALTEQNDATLQLVATLRQEWAARNKAEKIDTLIEIAVGDNYGKIIGQITNNYYTGTSPEVKAQALKTARNRYVQGLRQICHQLPLASLGLVNRPDKKVSLKQVYIQLDTTTRVKMDGSPLDTHSKGHSKGQRELRAQINPEEEETRLLKVHEAIIRQPYAVLLGDPGSGKSTFLKYYLAEYCAKEDGPLPILITLRTLASRLREAQVPDNWQQQQAVLIDHIIQAAIAEHRRYLDEEFEGAFEDAIRSGQCVLGFDGLDEVPVEERLQLRTAIQALNSLNTAPASTIITCRVRSYHGEATFEGYPSYTLADLNQEQMEQFASAWYAALANSGAYAPEHATERSEDLLRALRNRTIGIIGRNPMLLTTLAIVHEQDNHLPDQRVVLYDRAIEILLTRWEGARTKLETATGEDLANFLRDNNRIRPVLHQLAFMAHNTARGATDASRAADIEWTEALQVLSEAMDNNLNLAQEFLHYIDQRAGLLVGQGEASGLSARYSFAHRTFQEYLAGCYQLRLRDTPLVNTLKEFSAQGEYWSLAVQLAAEELYHRRLDENRLLDVAAMLCPQQVTTEVEARQALWAGLFANLAGSEKITANKEVFGGGGAALLKRLKHRLVDALRSTLPPAERAQCGRVLARLGDPRPEVLTIPDMQFCFVPKGPYLKGDEFDEEMVTYDYWIGRFHVTNAQYQVFIEAGGYEKKGYWSDEGWEKKRDKGWEGPQEFEGSFHLPNHPVVGVSWFEASAYASWLSQESLCPAGFQCVLPSADEWEKAARGGLQVLNTPVITALSSIEHSLDFEQMQNEHPKRRFAWKDDEEDANRMNYSGTELEQTAACGCFGYGASVYGVEEMNGQVWEWEETVLDFSGTSVRVLRGGAFRHLEYGCRCSYRRYHDPYYRYYFVGFRLVLRPAFDL